MYGSMKGKSPVRQCRGTRITIPNLKKNQNNSNDRAEKAIVNKNVLKFLSTNVSSNSSPKTNPQSEQPPSDSKSPDRKVCVSRVQGNQGKSGKYPQLPLVYAHAKSEVLSCKRQASDTSDKSGSESQKKSSIVSQNSSGARESCQSTKLSQVISSTMTQKSVGARSYHNNMRHRRACQILQQNQAETCSFGAKSKKAKVSGLNCSPDITDLTNDSDEEVEAPSEYDCPSRNDLLELTGSMSAAVNDEDVQLVEVSSQKSTGKHKLSGDDLRCDFIQNRWVGQDNAVLEKCCKNSVRPAETARKLDGRQKLGGERVIGSLVSPNIGSILLTANDLSCLQGSDWLNDEVVNSYMCLLQIRSQLASESSVGIETAVQSPAVNDETEDDSGAATFARESIPSTGVPEVDRDHFGAAPVAAQPISRKCLFYSSFFYALLRNSRGGYSYANVERWGRRHNIAGMDFVFFPINVSNSHWCLAVVEPQKRRIRYFDSMGGSNQHCLDLLERYLQDEGKQRDIGALTGDWNKECVGPPSVPAQSDGFNCGVFVCAFADCLSMGRDPAGFDQQDMPTIRAKLYKLLTRCNM